MASANDLYKLKPESVSNDVNKLCGYGGNHIPEVAADYYGILKNVERVEIRVIKDWCFDGERVWNLSTVWFDKKPVMIVQSAGRGGQDHDGRFISNQSLFSEMCSYLRSLVDEEEGLSDLIDPDEEIPELTQFYGYSLNGKFDNW